MSKSDECRGLAEKSLRAAQAISKLDARADLLQRAQVWLELAQWLEGQDGERPPPVQSERAQPVVQQQQQIQPKKNKKNGREG